MSRIKFKIHWEDCNGGISRVIETFRNMHTVVLREKRRDRYDYSIVGGKSSISHIVRYVNVGAERSATRATRTRDVRRLPFQEEEGDGNGGIIQR